MEFNQGNISTIATWLAMLISPILIRYGISIGQAELTTIIVAVIDLIIAIWSAYNPNTMGILGNAPEEEDEVCDDDGC